MTPLGLACGIPSVSSEDLPGLQLIQQKIDPTRIEDVSAEVRRQLARLPLGDRIAPGDSVALTAGSRGIADIVPVLREAVASLRRLGAEPFVVPAMGSHGGGTAAGQEELLAGYGIHAESVGAPVRASMEVVEIGRHPLDGPIFLDRTAAEADHIGVVARVKPHTGFSGAIESGLVKMMMIGLGKHEGAKEYHRALLRAAWEPFARSVAETILRRADILFGLAIIENARDETAHIEGLRPDEFLLREPELLERARRNMPRLPFAEADLLIIDQIGKDVSGSGADTNVIGRKPSGDWNTSEGVAHGPKIARLFIRGLTEATHGNAAGIGLADFTTDRLVEAMDYKATVINCLTANHPLAAAIPVHFRTDREAIVAALATVGLRDPRQAKVMWIRDTLHVEELAVSTHYDIAAADPKVEVLAALPWPFDAEGNLKSWWESQKLAGNPQGREGFPALP